MAANKSKSTGSLRAGIAIVSFFLRPHNRAAALTIAVAIISAGAAVYGWRQWADIALRSPEYQITADQISVTPQPAWIHSNVKDEALRAWGGANLSLLDRELVDKISHAFALHPWVANVVRVEKKSPPQINVELEYRRPVLAVKMDARDEQGLLFVDREGVLLPSADFSASQAKDYLRIVAAGETPTSIYGSHWASERIVGAARIAAALEKCWQPLGLYCIVAARGASNEFFYELQDEQQKTRVVWGSAPGHERSGEPAVASKVLMLERHLRESMQPGKRDDLQAIDLRSIAGAAANNANSTGTKQ